METQNSISYLFPFLFIVSLPKNYDFILGQIWNKEDFSGATQHLGKKDVVMVHD